MLVRLAKVAGVLLLAACSAAPQELEEGLKPEVLLLSRIKRHLREELAQVPNYTCLETISRYGNHQKAGGKIHKERIKLDTVQLEIVYTDGREWYGSPGAGQLSVDNPVAFIGQGMIGTGAFGIMMNNLVEGGIFKYRGEEVGGSRLAVKFDFRLPALYKPLEITKNGATGVVGEEGSLWVDPESLDLIRVEAHAVEIPPYLLINETSTSVEYARMRIAGTDTLLAQTADSRMVDDSGTESYNRIEFTHCHSYSSSSEITFDTKAVPDAGSVAAAPSLGPAVPAFLQVTILLTKAVSDKDSVGTLLQGKISGDVIRKGKIVIPDGSLVHGRIRALEHYPDLGAFAVGLEFMDVEVRGQSMPFYADFLHADEDSRTLTHFFAHVKTTDRLETVNQVITQPELPGVASFFVRGSDFTLPAGFPLVWRTRGLLH
ncbi:MAG TPA: hypothetical protein VMB03_33325 [Bryobacteraceae bacterium]|nr:hypothetical protein [Bryobacteraceae bacterium]